MARTKRVVEEEEKTEKEGASAKKKVEKKRLSTVPLVIGPNAGKEGKASLLIEVDASSGGYGGDTGAIGRLNFQSSSEDTFTVDLRGREHDAKIVPCRAMVVVSVGHDEAKIESVVSEYVQLSNSRDALAAFRGDAVVAGEYDDTYRYYEGDVDVNLRRGREDVDHDDRGASTNDKDAKKKGRQTKKSRSSSTKKK